jgi:hypothetical protein
MGVEGQGEKRRDTSNSRSSGAAVSKILPNVDSLMLHPEAMSRWTPPLN